MLLQACSQERFAGEYTLTYSHVNSSFLISVFLISDVPSALFSGNTVLCSECCGLEVSLCTEPLSFQPSGRTSKWTCLISHTGALALTHWADDWVLFHMFQRSLLSGLLLGKEVLCRVSRGLGAAG